MNTNGIPGPFWIGSTLVQLTPQPLPEPKRTPEPPSIDDYEPSTPPAKPWTLADELDERCNTAETMNRYGIRRNKW